MTPFVPLPDGAQLELIFSYGGEVVENRLWFLSRSPPIDQIQLDSLVAGVAGWHATQVMPFLSDQLFLGTVTARDWSSDPPPFVSTVFPSVAGSNISGGHSANVAFRMNLRSTNPRPLLINANFIPGIPLDAVNINIIEPTFRSAMFDAYVNLIDLVAALTPSPGWRWVVTSAWLDGSLRSEQQARRCDGPHKLPPIVAQRRKRLPAP